MSFIGLETYIFWDPVYKTSDFSGYIWDDTMLEIEKETGKY